MFVPKVFFEKYSTKWKHVVAIQKATYWEICKVAGISRFILFTRNISFVVWISKVLTSFFDFVFLEDYLTVFDHLVPIQKLAKMINCEASLMACTVICVVFLVYRNSSSFRLSSQKFSQRLKKGCFAVVQCLTETLVNRIAIQNWYFPNLAWKRFFSAT